VTFVKLLIRFKINFKIIKIILVLCFKIFCLNVHMRIKVGIKLSFLCELLRDYTCCDMFLSKIRFTFDMPSCKYDVISVMEIIKSHSLNSWNLRWKTNQSLRSIINDSVFINSVFSKRIFHTSYCVVLARTNFRDGLHSAAKIKNESFHCVTYDFRDGDDCVIIATETKSSFHYCSTEDTFSIQHHNSAGISMSSWPATWREWKMSIVFAKTEEVISRGTK
jgi:hypothetical protein